MAKKKKKAKVEEEVFYVGVQEPVEVRKNILEVSRDMVQFLQQYQKLSTIRNEKDEAIKHLADDVKNIKALVNKFKKSLPKTRLRIKIHEEHHVFQCDKCDEELPTEIHLEKHMKTHVQHRKKKVKHRKKKVQPRKKTVKRKAVKKTVAVKKTTKRRKAPKKKITKKETQATLAPELPPPASEIEKLESELTDIEDKLGRLS